jgi:hypothetical protein
MLAEALAERGYSELTAVQVEVPGAGRGGARPPGLVQDRLRQDRGLWPRGGGDAAGPHGRTRPGGNAGGTATGSGTHSVADTTRGANGCRGRPHSGSWPDHAVAETIEQAAEPFRPKSLGWVRLVAEDGRELSG